MKKLLFAALYLCILLAANYEVESKILSINPLSINGMVTTYIHSDKIVILQNNKEYYISDLYGKKQIKYIFTSSINNPKSSYSIISVDGLYFQNLTITSNKSILTVINIDTEEKYQIYYESEHVNWFNIDSKNNLAYYRVRKNGEPDKIFTFNLKTQKSKYLCDGMLGYFALAPNKNYLISHGPLKQPVGIFNYGVITLDETQQRINQSANSNYINPGSAGYRILTHDGDLTSIQFPLRENLERWSNTSRYITSVNNGASKIIEINETKKGLEIASEKIIFSSLENHTVELIDGNVFSPDDRYILVYLTELDISGHFFSDVRIGLVDIKEKNYIANPIIKIGEIYPSGILPVWISNNEILISDITNKILYLLTIK